MRTVLSFPFMTDVTTRTGTCEEHQVATLHLAALDGHILGILVAAAAANLHTGRTTEDVAGETRAVERRRALATTAVAGAEVRHRLVHNTIDGQYIVVEHILALVIQEVVVVNFFYTLLKLNLRSLLNGALLTNLTIGNIATGEANK